jgi:hypothetical protein
MNGGPAHFFFSSASQLVTSVIGILAVGKFTVKIRKRFPFGVTSKLIKVALGDYKGKSVRGAPSEISPPFSSTFTAIMLFC